MNKILLLPVLLLAGCAMHPRVPIDVSYLPNDCANAAAISRWMEASAKAPRAFFEPKEQYEARISAVKNQMWVFRSHCQR